MSGPHNILTRFRRCERGTIAILTALALPVVVGLSLGAMDLSRVMSNRQTLQDSVDAATLIAARSTATTDSDLQSIGSKALNANLVNLPGATLVSSAFTSGSGGQKVTGVATASVPATILGLFSSNTLSFSVTSEVMRSSKNLEVALILDTTGSMKGQNLTDMKAAASDLIDLVVKDSQTPFYSKVALVPYSVAVNAGPYADQVRGSISAMKTITGATRANPVVITSSGHGFSNGDRVYITGVGGMYQLNDNAYTVAGKTTNTFQLQGVDGRYYNAFTSGGSVSCTTPGCQYYAFDNPYGSEQVFEVSTCVSERTGANAYTDAAPSTTPVGRNYPASSNPCPGNVVTPLSSDKTALKASVNALTAGGSTGGHIGVAWGWYMVSPNFAYLFPTASQPAAYTTPKLVKAVVLMTDGEYNSPYCNGVIARDATSGSGSTSDHESCNAPNGSTYSQAAALCTAMKNAGVIVYVVGFQVANTTAAQNLVNNCPTDAAHLYTPSTGTTLKAAFQAIGQDLSNLRISK